MTRTRQTAKKTTGIEAPCIYLKIPKLQSTAVVALKRPTIAKPSPGAMTITTAQPTPAATLERPAIATSSGATATTSDPVPVPLDASSLSGQSDEDEPCKNEFCHMCGDGGSLFTCNSCTHVTCRRCILVADKDVDDLLKPDVKFQCVTCHCTGNAQLTPYRGFYQNGQPVLFSFLHIPREFQLQVHPEAKSKKMIIIHLRVNTIPASGPVVMLENFLQPFFTCPGQLVIKSLQFDLTTTAFIKQYH
ncbi:hypothetical protein J3R83DRAFT_5435 [Lanmaoa asiatica]|nr:hypothetical protein J3R83DRAFT_5435 [Lanmaoa asiatica]